MIILKPWCPFPSWIHSLFLFWNVNFVLLCNGGYLGFALGLVGNFFVISKLLWDLQPLEPQVPPFITVYYKPSSSFSNTSCVSLSLLFFRSPQDDAFSMFAFHTSFPVLQRALVPPQGGSFLHCLCTGPLHRTAPVSWVGCRVFKEEGDM
jgi:hypothetical protein